MSQRHRMTEAEWIEMNRLHFAFGLWPDKWMGVRISKCSLDLMAYAGIIHALRPSVVIETGTWHGGSAFFFASMCDLIGCGRVLTIDIKPVELPIYHPRIAYLVGDSVAEDTVRQAREWARGDQGLVVLDSAHEKPHVLAELRAYHDFVAVGNFLVVEDTNVNGHPVMPEYEAGPWEAVHEWMDGRADFVFDRETEPPITFAPEGYLRRVA